MNTKVFLTFILCTIIHLNSVSQSAKYAERLQEITEFVEPRLQTVNQNLSNSPCAKNEENKKLLKEVYDYYYDDYYRLITSAWELEDKKRALGPLYGQIDNHFKNLYRYVNLFENLCEHIKNEKEMLNFASWYIEMEALANIYENTNMIIGIKDLENLNTTSQCSRIKSMKRQLVEMLPHQQSMNDELNKLMDQKFPLNYFDIELFKRDDKSLDKLIKGEYVERVSIKEVVGELYNAALNSEKVFEIDTGIKILDDVAEKNCNVN